MVEGHLLYVRIDGVLMAVPFDARSRVGARVGADAKVGLGPSVTLAATVNPDFGQV